MGEQFERVKALEDVFKSNLMPVLCLVTKNGQLERLKSFCHVGWQDGQIGKRGDGTLGADRGVAGRCQFFADNTQCARRIVLVPKIRTSRATWFGVKRVRRAG